MIEGINILKMDMFIKTGSWGMIVLILASLENSKKEALFILCMYFGENNESRLVRVNKLFLF